MMIGRKRVELKTEMQRNIDTEGAVKKISGEDTGMYKEILDNLPVALFAKDASDDFRFILWNKKQEEITTIKRSQALGKTDSELFSPEAADLYRAADQAVVDSLKAVKIPEEAIATKEGGQVYLKTVKLPLERENRTVVVGISEDITEKVKSREQVRTLKKNLSERNQELSITLLQLIQAEKLESIGKLAAGVAHEVKNPLALLVMGVEYLSSGINPDDPNIPTILEEMRDAIHRADTIVRGLVNLSANHEIKPEYIDPVELTEHVLLLLRHEVNTRSVSIKRDFDTCSMGMMVDRGKFEQVLLNVFTNAFHAMEGIEQESELSIVIKSEERAGEEGPGIIIFEIRDNGNGIAKKDQTRLFDPFFTTKGVRAGTGLGLPVVRKIVELHQGQIQLGNRTKRGAILKMEIPAVPLAL